MNSKASKTFKTHMNESFPIKKYFTGARCLKKSFRTVGMSLGNLCFLMTGLSSFWKINFSVYFYYNEVASFPKGLIPLFYTTIDSTFRIFFLLNIRWNVNSDFNDSN